MSDRVYNLYDSYGSDKKLILWGRSRFGSHDDREVCAAVEAASANYPGSKLYVGFTPEAPKMKTAEQVHRQRLGNLRRRCERFPLFADQFMAEQSAKPEYSLEDAQRSQDQRKALHDGFYREFWEEHREDNEIRI